MTAVWVRGVSEGADRADLDAWLAANGLLDARCYELGMTVHDRWISGVQITDHGSNGSTRERFSRQQTTDLPDSLAVPPE